MNQTVSDFLENEYTGNWTPSYTSGCGKYYDRYGDDFSYDGMMRAGTIMSDTMRRHLEKAFIRTISDEEMEEVMFECHDTIYDLCLASELFLYESVIEFYELGDILLKNL